MTVACSVLLDADVVQCHVDADCAGKIGSASLTCVDKVCVEVADASPGVDAADAADAAPVDPIWGCLGKVTWGVEDTSATVVLRSRFVRFLGEAPVTKMTVKACGRLDPDCTLPYASGPTDDGGYVNLPVPKNFLGFLILTPPATFSTMVPSLVALVPPPDKDSDLDASIPGNLAPHLTSTGELNALLAQIDTKVDPALGNLLGIVLDCEGNPASGVSLRINPTDRTTVSYYTDSTGTPSVTAQETAQRGEAGFIKMPTGPVTITATVNALSRKMGTYTVLSRAGHITYLPISPGPNQ